MKLIHRVVHLDLHGGRFGLGLIRAEADIHRDDWFLTCHFVDDMVMPGTLMYECCAHALRVLLQRMGWVTDKAGACHEPVAGVKSRLKCRGPVTPETRHVIYEVVLKQIGYSPEPYVIADALMYADGHPIVAFRDMSMKISGVTRDDIEAVWNQRPHISENGKPESPGKIFTREKILAFAIGNPSEAFGEPYRVFDRRRVIARLPGPPYSFMDRVVHIEPQAWVLEPGGWIESEYRVPEDAWYFRANRTRSVPFCVVLEIALQPCGWLAAYCGSALKSQKDLRFRNLGGRAVMNQNIYPDADPLKVRCRISKVSGAGDMIIEHFDFMVLRSENILYEGSTYFGFFTEEALANQVGIREPGFIPFEPGPEDLGRSICTDLPAQAPMVPEDGMWSENPILRLPSKALAMIDRIESFIPDGGPSGLGFIRGIKGVDPDEWFFKAHFHQDPVWPGSLGIESFFQLLKFAALNRWPHLKENHCFAIAVDQIHEWTYRGQVVPKNKMVTVDAVVTHIEETPVPALRANGTLRVDGRCIYKMENFGIILLQA
jgi:3-hydroxymyristoyl/3-hydroxydecanoyl-(acyl carrier protein) dehydratase